MESLFFDFVPIKRYSHILKTWKCTIYIHRFFDKIDFWYFCNQFFSVIFSCNKHVTHRYVYACIIVKFCPTEFSTCLGDLHPVWFWGACYLGGTWFLLGGPVTPLHAMWKCSRSKGGKWKWWKHSKFIWEGGGGIQTIFEAILSQSRDQNFKIFLQWQPRWRFSFQITAISYLIHKLHFLDHHRKRIDCGSKGKDSRVMYRLLL